MGTPSWAGPLTTSLRGLWVSGLQPGNGGINKGAATPKPTTCQKGADSELPGWQPKETASQLPQERGTLETAWVASLHEREGVCEGEGTKDPGDTAPLAAAACRGNCWRVVDGRRVKTDLRIFHSSSTASLTVTRPFLRPAGRGPAAKSLRRYWSGYWYHVIKWLPLLSRSLCFP